MKRILAIKSKLIDWTLLFKPKPVEPAQCEPECAKGFSEQQQFLQDVRSLCI